MGKFLVRPCKDVSVEFIEGLCSCFVLRFERLEIEGAEFSVGLLLSCSWVELLLNTG